MNFRALKIGDVFKNSSNGFYIVCGFSESRDESRETHTVYNNLSFNKCLPEHKYLHVYCVNQNRMGYFILNTQDTRNYTKINNPEILISGSM